jgi:Fe-S cluster assembly iron-binding protein IscA
MALDESRENDEVFDDRGLTYIIEKELYERVRPIKVDYVNTHMGSGFNIASNMQQEASCGSSCSSC